MISSQGKSSLEILSYADLFLYLDVLTKFTLLPMRLDMLNYFLTMKISLRCFNKAYKST